MSSVVSAVRADVWIERGQDECTTDNAGVASTVPPYSDQKDGAKSSAYDRAKYMNLRQKYNRRTIQEQVRPKREAARSMCRPLKQWLYAHRDLPYPTRADKLQLAGVARMSVVQVSNWFANARRRLKKTVGSASAAVELSWGRRFKLYNKNVVGNQERLSISSDDDDDDDDREMAAEQTAEELFTGGNDDAESCDGAISSTSGQPCSSSSSSSSSSTTSGNSSGEEKDGVAPPGERRFANNVHPLLLLPGKFKRGIMHRYLSDAVGISYVIESTDDVSDSKLSGSPSSRDSALSASCRSTPTGDRQYEEVFERVAARLSGCDPGHGGSDEYDLESLEISAVHTLASLAAASNRQSLTKPTRNDAPRQQQQQQ